MKKKDLMIVLVSAAIVAIVVIVLVIVSIAGSGGTGANRLGEPTPQPEAKLAPVTEIPYKIAVSTDFVRELAYMFARGRTFKAEVIIGPGVDPLTYVSTAEDEKKILDADLFLYVGFGLEPGLEPLIAKLKDKVRCKAITSSITPDELIKSKDYPGGYDPHIWWDLDLWEKILLNTVQILSEADPEGQFDYGSTYQRYGESVSLLNHRFIELWSSYIPKERRVLVTVHPAFGYFGRLYDYTVKSIYEPFGTSYSKEKISELADFIAANKVPAIFPELGFPRKPIEELKAEVAKRGFDVKIGKELFSYSLKQDMDAKDYRYLGAGRTLMENIYAVLKTKDSMEMPK
jgi:manganese/zinc/iron transport system substrate-binding protein